MNQQVLGLDGIVENITITAQRQGANLVLSVDDPSCPQYSGTYYSAPAANINSLTIRGAGDNDTIKILGNLGLGATADGPTTIDTGTGTDTVVVGDGLTGNLDDLTGPVTVNANAGADDQLIVNDVAASDAETYTITGLSVTRSGAAQISYTNLSTLTLNGGPGGNTINLQSSVAPTSVVINAGR